MALDTQRSVFIRGYVDQLSVEFGDRLGLHVSTNARRYSIEIARIGSQRHLVWKKENMVGAEHPVPTNAATHGCHWPAVVHVSIPDHWRSGYYSVFMRVADPFNEPAPICTETSFVVRSPHPGRDTKILLQRTTNTDNAYNTWGGSSFYRGPNGPGRRLSFDRPSSYYHPIDSIQFISFDTKFEAELVNGVISPNLRDHLQEEVVKNGVSGIWLSKKATVVVERPGSQWRIDDVFGMGPACYIIIKIGNGLNLYDGTTAWGSCWHHWEHPFVIWAERAGFQIDYCVNSDLEFHPDILQSYRLVLSIGHDEHWSSPMRDHLEAYIANGGNAAFFSGNAAYWQVRSEDNGRALTCWKDDYKLDPIYPNGDQKLLSTLWSHHRIGRPENQLTGVSFAYGGYAGFFDQFPDGPGAYTIHRPDHWLFEGTGFKCGDLLGEANKIVNYECDGCEFEIRNGLPVPTCRDGTPDSFEILATAPAGLTLMEGSLRFVSTAIHGEGSGEQIAQPGAAVLGLYKRGGTVVTCGCTSWSDGLDGDKAVAQITKNVLDRLSC